MVLIFIGITFLSTVALFIFYKTKDAGYRKENNKYV
jgi:hypothetical protein